MVTKGPYIKTGLRVKPEWIDYNGHMNMAYYTVLFDQCIDDVFEGFGLGPDYIKERGGSYYTLEMHVHYVREVHLEDLMRVSLQLLDYDAKRCHYFQEMYHETEGSLAATSEFMCMHVDMNLKKAAPFPDDILANINAMYQQHKDLPRSERIGHVIGIRRR